MKDSPIWIVFWETESGDQGVHGYWTYKPTKLQLDQYLSAYHSEDFEAGLIYTKIYQFSEINVENPDASASGAAMQTYIAAFL